MLANLCVIPLPLVSHRYPAGIRRSVGQYNQAWEHYENPDTKRRLHNLLSVSGILDKVELLKPARASIEQLSMYIAFF